MNNCHAKNMPAKKDGVGLCVNCKITENDNHMVMDGYVHWTTTRKQASEVNKKDRGVK
jgi:hypothetical protein